jgi:DNA-binding NarL/FixJ family response regulator
VSKKVIGERAGGAGDSPENVVALISDASVREEIATVLLAQNFSVEDLGELEDLTDEALVPKPYAVVLWVGETIAPLAKSIEALAQRFDPAPIVIVCSSIHRWEVRTALAAGAAGVVANESLAVSLAPCLLAVGTGQTCVPRDQWRQIEPPALSSREKQILGLVVMGYMNSQIAERLFLAESTVKSHLSSAFGKLGVRSRNEAVNLIIDPERGLGMGILGLGGEPLETISTGSR